MSLVPVDPKSEISVIALLEHAGQWLAEAVHRGEAGEVAAIKAQIATAAEATKQLSLSKDIQLDAQEMVRRAEYALARAIRRGQAEGTIRARGEHAVAHDRWNGVDRETVSSTKASPKDFASRADLLGNRGGDGIYALADGIEPEDFDVALDEAKAEGNLSRANLVRKVKNQAGPATRDQRADLIADLAAQGYSSRQMPSKVGVTEEVVRRIARDFDIDIPADKVIGRTRRLDHTHMVASTVNDLVLATEFIEAQIDLSEVDFAEADEWLSSLTHSIRALNRFKQQIKEHSHV